MKREAMNRHIDELVANPKRWFDKAQDVLDEPGLTAEERKRILESWKQDSQQLADATAENMSGGEQAHLREVAKALVTLEETEHPASA